MLRKLVRVIAALIGSVGVLSFVVNWCLGVGLLKPSVELPLHDIQQISCVGGKAYVGLGYYSRIQVYGDNGRFLEALDVENYSKPYTFRLDEKVRPVIRVHRSSRIEEPHSGRIEGLAYILDACSKEGGKPIIRQHLMYYLLGGPFTSALLGFMGVLLMLVLYPGFFTWVLERDKRQREQG